MYLNYLHRCLGLLHNTVTNYMFHTRHSKDFMCELYYGLLYVRDFEPYLQGDVFFGCVFLISRFEEPGMLQFTNGCWSIILHYSHIVLTQAEISVSVEVSQESSAEHVFTF